jgi:tetratricopeptide (TPR) repeat protein
MREVTFLFLLMSCLISNRINAQLYSKPPKFAVEVYNSIFNAMNDNRTERPELKLSNNPKEVATRIPKDTEGESVVVIGQGLIDIARSFGTDSSNALAHVLGHELAHVFKHQNDLKRVGSGYASDELKREIRELSDSLSFNVFERQADEYAVFYCHISGYRTVHIGAAVLDSIYQKFQLTDNKLRRYPSLIERKEIVRNSEKKMKALCMMYDDGMLALANGNIAGARGLFREILENQFTSCEIYNNYGLCFLLEVINNLDTLSYPYSFPVQFDFQTNLNLSLERGLDEDLKSKLLRAVDNFTKAISYSSNYYVGHLNMAVAYFLLEDYLKMNEELNTAIKSENPLIQEAIKNLTAIYFHYTGDYKSARSALKNTDTQLQSSMRNRAIVENRKVKNGGNTPTKAEAFNKSNGSEVFDLLFEISKGIKDFDFSSSEAISQGREVLKYLGEGLGVKMRMIENNEVLARRWIVNGHVIGVYERKIQDQFSELEWEYLKSQSRSSFQGNYEEILVFNDFVLKKSHKSLTLYKIR